MTRGVFGMVRRWPGRWHRRFRLWRRGRPFWGGLLLILAGAELWSSTSMSPLHFEISFGPQAYLTILLPVALVLCGLLAWITPQHRHFYSIIGTLTALYSLLGLNLGGLFLGMLLGIIGGSLTFAWTPVVPRPAEAPPEVAGPAGDVAAAGDTTPEQPAMPRQSTGPLTDSTPGADQIAPVQAPRQPPRTFVVAVLPLLLAGAAAVPLATVAQGTEPCTTQTVAETPSPSPSPEPTSSPEPCEPEPPATTEPPSTTEPPGPPPTGAAPATEPPATGELGGGDSASPSPEPSLTPPPEVPVPPDHPLVSTDPSLMTADRLDLVGFRFEGIAELPTAEGTITTLKFTFDRATAADAVLISNRRGDPQTVTADPLVLSGDVVFYASRFTGRALGILPVTLDPDSPGLLEELLQLVDLPLPIYFTEVEQELVFTTGGQLTATGFGQTGAAA